MTNAAISNLQFRDLELADIPELAGFAPENWNMALDAVLLQHIGRSYFHGLVAVDGDRILGVGQGISTGAAGWVGNIIVRPEARKSGLGTRITADLVYRLRGQACGSLILIATVLGEPVYFKLGFRKTHEYVFYKVPRLAYSPVSQVRRLAQSHVSQLLALDAFATSETRTELLAPHIENAWVHTNGRGDLDGFFLPSFGAGLVIATNPAAGIDLLGFKHSLYPGNAVVPAGNIAAIEFLTRNGAEETLCAPRMVLGDEVAWQPACIFARATGYSG